MTRVIEEHGSGFTKFETETNDSHFEFIDYINDYNEIEIGTYVDNWFYVYPPIGGRLVIEHIDED
jgi:hypothetical protein